MQVFTSLRRGSVKALLLTFLFVTGSVLTVFTSTFTQTANAAMTETKCYTLNGTDYNSYVASDTLTQQKECVSLGFCKTPTSAGLPGSNQLPKMECNRAYYETTDQYKAEVAANNAKILDARIAPLVDIICKGITADVAKQACINDVKGQYTVCENSDGVSVGNPTEDEINAAIGSCMNAWTKKAYPSVNTTLAKLTAAVVKGRNDGAELAKTQGAEKDKASCESSGGTWVDSKCITKAAAQCSGGPLGWILCPVADMAVSITSELGKNISSIMTFTPLLNSTQGKAIESVWRIVVNIANILLVIAFLMVVFSQATSVGLTNYGIKKMLPKIVAAAILMNLSFFLCAVAVDISNIIGQSVAGIMQVGIDLLKAPPSGLIDGGVKTGSDAGDIAMFSLFASLGTAGLIATGNIFLVLPILASAAVAVFTAFVVIMLRQVAVVIMIIIAPLAFAAWILPNTESWFEKWRKLFISLLLMFPLIMAIMYGATFMSRVMLVTLDPTKPGMEVNTVKIMAIAVLLLPLFAMPFIMKTAGGILERFGAWTNNRSKGIIDRSRNKANEWRGNTGYQRSKESRKNERQNRRAEKFARNMSADTTAGKMRRAAYGGMRITPGQRADTKASWANIYDENRERIAKNTERERGRATDFAAFTAGSKYHLERNGKAEEVDKDTWMNTMYTDSTAKGSVTDLSNKTHQFDASDSSFNSAIASQAAKSGDKAMYGKLLKRSMAMQSEAQAVLADGNASDSAKAEAKLKRDQGAELEFKLRDFGVNNAGVVAGGHPDVVKGQYSAYKSISAEGLLAMDGSAVERMGAYLSHGDNTYKDLIVGSKENARVKLQAEVDDTTNTRTSFSDADVQAMADDELGRTGTDANGRGIYGAGRVTSYIDTAKAAFEEAVYQLNTKDIYSGKAVKGGDLDKAVMSAGVLMSMNTGTVTPTAVKYQSGDVRFGNPGMQRNLSQAGGTVAQANSTPPAPTIQLNIQTPSGAPYPQPAHQVNAQVQQAGGWSKLPPEQVVDIYNHANSLPSNNDSAQLSADALDELRNRGIFPPASGSNP